MTFRAYFRDITAERTEANFVAAKAFRRRAWGNPRHQKPSGGAIISNAGSHRPATDASRRSFSRPLLPPSDTLHPMSPCPCIRCPSGYPGVFCHHCNYISPFSRFPDRPCCKNINTIVSRQNDSSHSHRKWRHARSVRRGDGRGILLYVRDVIFTFFADSFYLTHHFILNARPFFLPMLLALILINFNLIDVTICFYTTLLLKMNLSAVLVQYQTTYFICRLCKNYLRYFVFLRKRM